MATPLFELLPVALGDTQKAKDHSRRQRERQAGDEVERHRRINRV